PFRSRPRTVEQAYPATKTRGCRQAVAATGFPTSEPAAGECRVDKAACPLQDRIFDKRCCAAVPSDAPGRLHRDSLEMMPTDSTGECPALLPVHLPEAEHRPMPTRRIRADSRRS